MARLGSVVRRTVGGGFSDASASAATNWVAHRRLAAIGAYLAEAVEAGTTPSLAGYAMLARSRGRLRWPPSWLGSDRGKKR